jgi:hypothetical protein
MIGGFFHRTLAGLAGPLLACAALGQEPQLFQGGNGRGDAVRRFSALAQPLFAGGTGRGDARTTFAGLAQPLFAGGAGRGDARTAFEGPVDLPFAGGTGRGDAHDAALTVGSSPFAGGLGRGDAQRTFAGIDQPMFAGGDGRGDALFTFTVTLPTEVFLSLHAALSGPYDPATGLMNDALRSLATFPITEPYTALGYVHVNGGGEALSPALLTVTGANALVDWVVVELRDAVDADVVVATRSALLQRDGDVVAPDGVSPVSFGLPSGTYHVSVLHRNHLGAMTASPIAITGTPASLDLASAATPTFGTQARKPIAGTVPTQALWAGDVTFNGQLKYTGGTNDRDPILQALGGTAPTATLIGQYRQEDVNLDGTVKYTGGANDRDPILVNIGGVVPTAVRNAQLP